MKRKEKGYKIFVRKPKQINYKDIYLPIHENVTDAIKEYNEWVAKGMEAEMRLVPIKNKKRKSK